MDWLLSFVLFWISVYCSVFILTTKAKYVCGDDELLDFFEEIIKKLLIRKTMGHPGGGFKAPNRNPKADFCYMSFPISLSRSSFPVISLLSNYQ